MKIFIIVYIVNFIVLIVEAFGLIKFAEKLNVDMDDAFKAFGKHAPFGTYPNSCLAYICVFILDFLIISPLLEHFTHALMACEIYNLHHEKESA